MIKSNALRVACVISLIASLLLVTNHALANYLAEPYVNREVRPIYLPDDTEALVKAASEGINSVKSRINAHLDITLTLIDALKALLNQNQKDLAAIQAQIQAMNKSLNALRVAMNALRDQLENLEELEAQEEVLKYCDSLRRTMEQEFAKLIREVETQIREAEVRNQPTESLRRYLLTLKEKRDKALRDLEVICARMIVELKKLAEEITKTAKVRRILITISRDRLKAEQLTDLIRKNNRTGIAEFLKREGGGGEFVISDAKLNAGPLLIFRVDALSHCLSGGGQCSGKLYSFSN